MKDKEFTDELFKCMYALCYDRAEVENGVVYFYKKGQKYLQNYNPRVPVDCTCFENKEQRIDIERYLGIIDWSKVAVDTPILVKGYKGQIWKKRHFAFFRDGKIYVWASGGTSWSCNDSEVVEWKYSKLAEV